MISGVVRINLVSSDEEQEIPKKEESVKMEIDDSARTNITDNQSDLSSHSATARAKGGDSHSEVTTDSVLTPTQSRLILPPTSVSASREPSVRCATTSKKLHAILFGKVCLSAQKQREHNGLRVKDGLSVHITLLFLLCNTPQHIT